MLVKSTFYTSCKRMSFQIFLQNKKITKTKLVFFVLERGAEKIARKKQTGKRRQKEENKRRKVKIY
jgi:hypothetical protein